MKYLFLGLLSVVFLSAGPAAAQCVQVTCEVSCPPPCCKKKTCSGYWTMQRRTVYVPGHWTWRQHPCGEFQRAWAPPRHRVVWVRVRTPHSNLAPAICRR
jgi:hypothetical protein